MLDSLLLNTYTFAGSSVPFLGTNSLSCALGRIVSYVV